MQAIPGVFINKLGFNAQKLGDFIYHEGPLLSLYADDESPDTFYFYKWADCDETANRWLIAKVSRTNLRRFFARELSLRQILLENPFVHLLDLDDELNSLQIQLAAVAALPEDYLPATKSIFSAERYTVFASQFKESFAQDSVTETLGRILTEIASLKTQQSSHADVLNLVLQQNAGQKPLQKAF